MKRTVIIVCALITLGATILVGQRTPQGQYDVYGSGAASCGAWTGDLRNEVRHALQKMWVLGFISGAGWGTARPQLKPTDADGIDQFITTYCAGHPLEAIHVAAEACALELRK